MKYKTLDQIHADAMQDVEYRAAYEEESTRDRLRDTLEGWRKSAGLTSAQVA